jgi:3-deoxy-D-manno-octulosonic-acid transferase
MLAKNNVAYDRLSCLIQGERRNHSLILVDSIGDLAEIYSIATFVFVGGSLTPYGGHNVMEAAIWEKIIFFGPYIDDFREAAEWLVKSGGGFMIDNVGEMEDQLCAFLNDRDKLIEAQKCAGKAARERQGAGEQQAQLILQVLGTRPLNGER